MDGLTVRTKRTRGWEQWLHPQASHWYFMFTLNLNKKSFTTVYFIFVVPASLSSEGLAVAGTV